jgi:dipeptidyl-peptidase-4
MTSADDPSFPRQNARTQRFTLGRPRNFTVSPDGERVLFIRSAHGSDRVGQLWRMDAATGEETQLVDPAALLGESGEALSAEERARRERMRESAGGLVGYATDRDVRQACFALSGRLFVTDLGAGSVRELAARSPVVDPRLDPTGSRVAYASGGELRLTELDRVDDRAVAGAAGDVDGPDVSYGLADFVAAEELGRTRGFWWAPSGDRLLVERVDDSRVEVWHVSDPAHPELPATPQRYPAAGTPNAEVSLWLVDLQGNRTPVSWDRSAFEYLASVHWSERGAPIVQGLDRLQGQEQVLEVDPVTGTTSLLRERTDPCWVDVVPGVPCWGPDGQLLTVEVAGDRYALCADGDPVTPEGLDVRAVLDVDADDVLLLAADDPTEQHVWRWSAAGLEQLTSTPGLHAAARGGGTVVTSSTTLEDPLPTSTVTSSGQARTVRSNAEVPALRPEVSVLPAGRTALRVAVVLPRGHLAGSSRLPVLLDPYGGPHGSRVLRSEGAFRESQWFADQGFAVVVVDGRGTPGSPSWERAVRFDLADGVLDDQVVGLQAAAHAFPDLDLSRVAIRGWSFGGFLSALAVLRRPDTFHAAVAGAPVTEWRWYDTGYTERYLGLPESHPEAYQRSSLLADAPALSRPLMLIHGFADDNVFVAHTLRLSAELTAAGRPHTVLPLSGVTHMASQEDVAESLLQLQVEFLRQALAEPPPG